MEVVPMQADAVAVADRDGVAGARAAVSGQPRAALLVPRRGRIPPAAAGAVALVTSSYSSCPSLSNPSKEVGAARVPGQRVPDQPMGHVG